jgi:hypothetical protein
MLHRYYGEHKKSDKSQEYNALDNWLQEERSIVALDIASNPA